MNTRGISERRWFIRLYTIQPAASAIARRELAPYRANASTSSPALASAPVRSSRTWFSATVPTPGMMAAADPEAGLVR